MTNHVDVWIKLAFTRLRFAARQRIRSGHWQHIAFQVCRQPLLQVGTRRESMV